MVIEARATQYVSPVARATYRYGMYGLQFLSDRPIVDAPLADGTLDGDAVHLVWPGAEATCGRPNDPPTATLRCEHGTTILTRYDDASGSWLHHRSFGTFHMAAGGARVAVYPRAGVDPAMLDGTLTSQIPIFLLHQRQAPSLHASSIVTEHGAAVFLGPKGQGKSTIAASFIRSGAALLADDTLPLRVRDDEVYGVPSLPTMKLWPQTATHTLHLEDDLPGVAPHQEKRLLSLGGRFPFAQEPARVRAIYSLERHDPATFGQSAARIRPLSGRDSLALLLSQTSLRSLLRPSEFATLLHTYKQLVSRHPVRVLAYRDGFEHQDAVYAAVRADMAAL
jgi:hypothetical protein